jgi:HEAT repeat protein
MAGNPSAAAHCRTAIERAFVLGLAVFALVAVAGVYSAERLGKDEPRTGDQWVTALRAPDADARAIAAYEAGRKDAPDTLLVRELTALVSDTVGDVRQEAVASLVRIARRSRHSAALVAAALQPIVADATQLSERIDVARILGTVGPGAVRATDALETALMSADPELRAVSVSALGQIGSASDQIVRHITDRTSDSSATVRAAAIEALLRLRPDSAATTIGAAMLRRDPSELVRVTAAYCLVLGEARESVIAALTSALEDKAPEVQRAAAKTLSRLELAHHLIR